MRGRLYLAAGTCGGMRSYRWRFAGALSDGLSHVVAERVIGCLRSSAVDQDVHTARIECRQSPVGQFEGIGAPRVEGGEGWPAARRP